MFSFILYFCGLIYYLVFPCLAVMCKELHSNCCILFIYAFLEFFIAEYYSVIEYMSKRWFFWNDFTLYTPKIFSFSKKKIMWGYIKQNYVFSLHMDRNLDFKMCRWTASQDVWEDHPKDVWRGIRSNLEVEELIWNECNAGFI